MWLLIVAIVSGLLLVFGMWYAVTIARKPLPPGKTYLEVVVGTGVTNVGISSILVLLMLSFFPSAEWWQVGLIAIVPWWAYGLTGVPMIVGQVVKAIMLHSEAASVLATLYDSVEDFGKVLEAKMREGDDNSSEGVAEGADERTR